MIQLKPIPHVSIPCECGGQMAFSEYLWQGLHICKKVVCERCNRVMIESLPVNQSGIETYKFFPDTGLIKNADNETVRENWFSKKLAIINSPEKESVDLQVTVFRKYNEVIILNTLDYVYGHSLLFFLNLQRLLNNHKELGIIIIVQPMLKWMIPSMGIAEIWTVNLELRHLNNYYPDLTTKINNLLSQYSRVYLSKGHIIPTNENINIEMFTGVRPYDFSHQPAAPGITFIWREDPDRLWIRNFYILKGCKKLGLSKMLLPLHYCRVLISFYLLRKRFGKNFSFCLAGLGRFGKFPSYIDDQRIKSFDADSERKLCVLYSRSVLVFGVHGSGMILPSAHAGMTVSLMPSKRWGNFAEDILFSENDIRIATFQRRVVPLNLCIFDLIDIITDMISGRDYFIRKFVHSDEL